MLLVEGSTSLKMRDLKKHFVSMMEALVFYVIKIKYGESSRSLLIKKYPKYVEEKSWKLENGKVLVLAEKSIKEEISPPSFAHMLDFVDSNKVFASKLVKAMRDMKDVRNSVHIYDNTKDGLKLSDEDVEKHQDVWGRVFLEVESILTK